MPDAGHVVWLSLDPQLGHEQSGRRPFLVLTPSAYNGKTSLVAGLPITGRRKGYPFEVPLPSKMAISGVVLADQIKSLDWRERHAEFAEEAPISVVRAVRDLVATLLGLTP